MVSDIYSFHLDIGDSRLNDTVGLWESIWKKHGWTPHVLGIKDAMRHPAFGKMWVKAEAMPTVNDRNFSTVNFLRWCAFARVNGAVSDYDVLPRSNFPPRQFTTFFSGDRDGGPGFLVGTCSDFEKIVTILLGYSPSVNDITNGRPHVSDMVIQRYHQSVYQSREDLVRCYGAEGWRSVPLTHFGNSYLDSNRSKRDQITFVLRNEGVPCE